MNAIVCYRSKTGFTGQYAHWIANALGCEAAAYEERGKLRLADYDTVIYGDHLHVGKLGGLSWLEEKLPKLAGKRIAVFAVGSAPAGDPIAVSAMKTIFQSPVWAEVETFYFQGGLRYEQMGALDKLMMSAMRAVLKKTEGPDSEAYRAVSRSFDGTDRHAVGPLVEWAKS